MPRFCVACGTQNDESAAFCAKCGIATGQAVGAGTAAAPASAPAPLAQTATAADIQDNLAGMLAYLFIPAIVFLVMEPYNKRPFVRFHSFQCIFLVAAEVAASILLYIFASIPLLGLAVVFVVGPLFALACFVLWAVLLIKSYQNEKFELPFIGALADKQANA